MEFSTNTRRSARLRKSQPLRESPIKKLTPSSKHDNQTNKTTKKTATYKSPKDVQTTSKKSTSKETNIIQIDSDSTSEEEEEPYLDSGSEYSHSSSDGTSSEEESAEEEEEEEIGKKTVLQKVAGLSKRLNEEEEEEEEEEEIGKKRVVPKIPKPSKGLNRSNLINKKLDRQYFMNTDEYFSNHTSKKSLTSNHTLNRLETPRLPQTEMDTLLNKLSISDEHKTCLQELNDSYESVYEKWMYFLHENINILLYGLGSKRQIMKEFQSKYLTDMPVIVVNGFFPSITIKEILDAITVDLLELTETCSNVYEMCGLIEKHFTTMPDIHLYILIHNIEMIRSNKAQNALSRLASISNLHFIASIDHINAPLVWDHSKLSKFNFSWWNITTFRPYIQETSFENAMVIQQNNTLALSSLRNVFMSLTSNSKGIYLLLVRRQLDNANNQYYQGMTFKDLYWACREKFLVSSDLALRAQLTEFVDHKMIKLKRAVDGVEYLNIPIRNDLLEQFLNENNL